MLKAKKVVCLKNKFLSVREETVKDKNTKYKKQKELHVEQGEMTIQLNSSEKFFVDNLLESKKLKVNDKGHIKQVSELSGYMLDMLIHKED